VEDVRRRAAADGATVGVLLMGSRASGSATEGSDYDLVWVVTELTGDVQVKDGDLDIHYLTIGRLRERVDDHDWATGALLTAQVVWDPTGELARVLDQMRARAGERARADVPTAYDAYLNSYVRSLKAWRRGNELGGRMHAVESLGALARTLFGVAGHWPTYHDELEGSLPELERELGVAVLADARTIAATGDPSVQQGLETRVEQFMSGRGIEHEWDDALDKLRAWTF
jgi:predicted nucleotidyltransferase